MQVIATWQSIVITKDFFARYSFVTKIMKLISVLLFVACLHTYSRGHSQTITLSVKDAPLDKVFKLIEQQTDFVFFIDKELIARSKKVTIKVSKPLEEVLELCFKNQPFTYHIAGKIISLAPRKEKPDKEVAETQAPGIDIKGRIVNAEGEPIPNATVSVNGTEKKTITDINGNFVLTGVNQNAVLTITHVQYEMKNIAVNGHISLNATLQIKVGSLDELQIIAYGTTTRRMNTGNVTKVKSADIEKQPVNNPLLALEGRVPGLFVTQSTGYPGSGVKVRIEGVNSISGGNDPLYIIDGVPYTSQLLPQISAVLGGSGGNLVNNNAVYGNPLSFINPSDIESIEILKDADATAIYGSRAANGAILITTKKGKAGEQRIEFNLQQGWGKVTRRLDMMDRRQYLDMRYEALKNDGTSLSSLDQTGNYDLTVWDTTKSTDWQKTLIGNTAHYSDYQVMVSGGNVNNQYSIGGGYHRETSVLPLDFNDQKASLHLQLSSASKNQKFKMQFASNYMVDINKLPHVVTTDLTELALQLAPVAPALYNADGSINWALSPAGNSTWDYPGNPVAQLLNKYKNTTYNIVNNATISYEIIPGLFAKSSFGYTNLQSNEKVMAPLAAIAPESRPTSRRVGVYANSNVNSWVIEPQLNYQLKMGRGKFDALLGGTIQQKNSEQQRLYGYGYISDAAIDNIRSASTIEDGGSFNYVYKYNALFTRLSYQWNAKYFINLNARRDGSSRFGSKNQFHNFGSIGAAWIFSEESFIKNNLPFLSFGKIKSSFGTTGNDQIGEYLFLSLYTPVTLGVPYQGINTIQLNNLPNPYIQWEQTKKLSVGVDLGFLGERVLISANYFRNRSSNQLLAYQLPIMTGFSSITQNFPATVENTGWEFSVNSTNLKSKMFSWSSNFNLTLHRNKLISFPGIENSSYANYLVVGKPVTLVRKFHLIGVDPGTGVYYFDSKTNPFNPKTPDDANVWINTSPTFFGGLENSFSFNGIELSFLFQFVKQQGPNYYFGRFPGLTRVNQPTYIMDRWQKSGDQSPHQKYNASLSASSNWINASYSSDAAYSDASYIRLKNVSLSWQLPLKYINTLHIQSLRAFVQAQNLLTITNYKGLDPETLSSSSLPPLRVVTVGLRLSI